VDDAARVFRLEGPTGVRLKLARPAPGPRGGAGAERSLLGRRAACATGRGTNRTWFAAVQVEKRMMFIILTLIVAVAAFNLVSTLVMTVTDKRADIAILRTLGASPASIMGIFVVQGAHGGRDRHACRAWLLGLVRGVQHRRASCRRWSGLLGASFLPQDIYLISRMPSDPQSGRHRADRADLAGAGLRGHAVPELARQPRQPRPRPCAMSDHRAYPWSTPATAWPVAQCLA